MINYQQFGFFLIQILHFFAQTYEVKEIWNQSTFLTNTSSTFNKNDPSVFGNTLAVEQIHSPFYKILKFQVKQEVNKLNNLRLFQPFITKDLQNNDFSLQPDSPIVQWANMSSQTHSNLFTDVKNFSFFNNNLSTTPNFTMMSDSDFTNLIPDDLFFYSEDSYTNFSTYNDTFFPEVESTDLSQPTFETPTTFIFETLITDTFKTLITNTFETPITTTTPTPTLTTFKPKFEHNITSNHDWFKLSHNLTFRVFGKSFECRKSQCFLLSLILNSVENVSTSFALLKLYLILSLDTIEYKNSQPFAGVAQLLGMFINEAPAVRAFNISERDWFDLKELQIMENYNMTLFQRDNQQSTVIFGLPIWAFTVISIVAIISSVIVLLFLGEISRKRQSSIELGE